LHEITHVRKQNFPHRGGERKRRRNYLPDALIPDNGLNRFAHLGSGSFAIFAFRLSLEPLLHFGFLALLALLFLLTLLECLRTTSSQ